MITWRGKYIEKGLTGVYGLYIGKKLIYIGSTQTSFEKRLQSHNSNMGKSVSFLYQCLHSNRNHSALSMKPLIVKEYVRVSKPISAEDLGWMELALISSFRPMCNSMGIKSNYVFPKERV